jgi:hypothetical protein
MVGAATFHDCCGSLFPLGSSQEFMPISHTPQRHEHSTRMDESCIDAYAV